MTKAQKEARKRLKKACPTMFESVKKRRERNEGLRALLKRWSREKLTEEDYKAGEELQRALAEAHGYERE